MLIYERVEPPAPALVQASPRGGMQMLSLTSPHKQGSPSLPYDMAPVLFYVCDGCVVVLLFCFVVQ